MLAEPVDARLNLMEKARYLITLITPIISHSGACSETATKLQDGKSELETCSNHFLAHSRLLYCFLTHPNFIQWSLMLLPYKSITMPTGSSFCR